MAEEQGNLVTANEWNDLYPIGTAVTYWPGTLDGPGRQSHTRTPAWTLGGGHAVVSVDGYAGGIWLEHVQVEVEGELQGG